MTPEYDTKKFKPCPFNDVKSLSFDEINAPKLARKLANKLDEHEKGNVQLLLRPLILHAATTANTIIPNRKSDNNTNNTY